MRDVLILIEALNERNLFQEIRFVYFTATGMILNQYPTTYNIVIDLDLSTQTVLNFLSQKLILIYPSTFPHSVVS